MKYEIILADPPWLYYGDPNKNAAAGKHYKCMSIDDLTQPHRWLNGGSFYELAARPSVIFMWATGPMLQTAINVMTHCNWGFHYRGIAYVWVKTRKDGGIISGQGVRPSFTKPTTELLLVGSTNSKGRAFPILNEAQPQVVLHPRLAHSEKPPLFRDMIVDLLGDRPRIELFARQRVDGWDAIGDELEDMPGGRRMA